MTSLWHQDTNSPTTPVPAQELASSKLEALIKTRQKVKQWSQCSTIYGKTFEGENFPVFTVFHSITNLLIMALSIGNISLQACYCENLPANNHFTNVNTRVFSLQSFTVHSISLSTIYSYLVVLCMHMKHTAQGVQMGVHLVNAG